MKAFDFKVIGFYKKKPVFFLIFLLLIILVQIFYLKIFVSVDSDLKSLFDKSSITVMELNELEEQMPNFSSIIVTASSPDREKNIKVLKEIRNRIKKDPLIRYVDLERETDYLKTHALLYVPLEKLKDTEKRIRKNIANYTFASFATDEYDIKEKIEVSKILDEILETSREYRDDYKFRRYMEAQNGTLVSMYVRPNCSDTDLREIQKTFEIIDSAILSSMPDKHGVKVEANGPFRKKLTDTEDILKNYITAMLTAFLLMLFLTIYHYRSFKATIIVVISLFTGILSALTSINLINGHVNIAMLLTFPLILGIGLNSIISHLNRHMLSKADSGFSIQKWSWLNSTLLSSVLAVAALAPFLSGSFKGFLDFMLATFTGVLFFIPAAIISLTGLVCVFRLEPFLKIPELSFRHTVFILLIVLSVGIVVVFSTEDFFSEANGKGQSLCIKYTDSVKNDRNNFLATGLPSFILTDSPDETKDASETLDRIGKNPNKKIQLKNYISINKFIPDSQKEKLRILKYIRKYIEQKKNLLDRETAEKYYRDFAPYLNIDTEITKENLPSWIKDKLSLKNGDIGRLLILGLGGNKSDVKTVMEIKKEYGTIKGKKNYYTLKGSYLLLTEIDKILKKNWGFLYFISFVLSTLILFIKFRSFSTVFPQIISFGIGLSLISIPFFLGLKLSIYNIAVFPIILGFELYTMIVDIKNFKDYPTGKTKNSGCCRFRHHTLIASITLFAFFIILSLSQHSGQRSFGIIAATGIFSTTAARIIFPKLIKKTVKIMSHTINKWRKKCTE